MLTPSERLALDAGCENLALEAEIEETQAVLDAYAETDGYRANLAAMYAAYPAE